MARISLDPPGGMFLRIMKWYSRRAYGKVLDPGLAYAHNRRVLWSYLRFEQSLGRWKRLDDGLKMLAVMATASHLGCSWCMDFGYWEAVNRGLPREKIRNVPSWRDHPEVYTELERTVMEYAEAMSETPVAVTDELSAALRDRLGEAAFVELTAMIGVEQLRSRVNSAFGLTGQGFKESCEVVPG